MRECAALSPTALSRLFPNVAMFALLIAAGWSAPAVADGGFVPPAHFETFPDIPTQTAAIVFRDGHETLIVESAARPAPNADRLAWILPLPAEPTSLEKFSPGALATLRLNVGYEIGGYPRGMLNFWIIGLLMSISLTGFIEEKDPKKRASYRDWFILFGIMGFLVLIAVAGPNDPAFKGTEELRSERVGNYDATTLRAQSAEDLQAWLREKDFAPLPAEGVKVVEDYIREGWVFVVSRLRREGGELLTPHPLKAVFPAKEPIFPMRLTALGAAREKTDVRLFVIGDHFYMHPQFETICAAGLSRAHDDTIRIDKPIYSYLAHPDLLNLLWGKTSISCLSASLASSEMKKDIVLTADSARKAGRKLLYARRALVMLALGTGFWTLAFLLPIAGWIARDSRRAGFRFAGIALCVSALAAGWSVWGLPRAPHYRTEETGHLQSVRWRISSQMEAIAQREIRRGLPLEETRQAIAKRLTREGGKSLRGGARSRGRWAGRFLLPKQRARRAGLVLGGRKGRSERDRIFKTP
jgi:hypothetical protein